VKSIADEGYHAARQADNSSLQKTMMPLAWQ